MQKQTEDDVFVANESLRLIDVVSRICKKLDTPVTLKCSDYYRLRDNRYFELTLDPLAYSEENIITFSYDLFATDIFSKSINIFDSLDPDVKGFQKFIKSELKCYKTNQVLYVNKPERDVEECLLDIRRKIADILGPLNENLFKEALSWGPGVTKTVRGRYANLTKLMEYPFQCPETLWKQHSNNVSSCYPYLKHISGIDLDGPCCLLTSSYSFDDVARVVVVPKTSKVSRPITVEPTGLAAYAASVGQFLRGRLKRAGVDLSDQTINREYARKAYEIGLATVDLSSASDNISLLLIHNLLPKEWADFLCRVRSTSYNVDDPLKKYQFEKFAGMGNGITFPLESLIFYAVSYCVSIKAVNSSGFVSVYGDDIIIDAYAYPLLFKVLKFLGFDINQDKTHILPFDGYRESCGGQYFYCTDVTPVYIREVNKDLNTCVRNHNRLYRWLVTNQRFDLLPILGSLRPQHASCIVVGEDIPESDLAFFLFRGKTHFQPQKIHKSFLRVRSGDYLWLSLYNLTNKLTWHDELTLHISRLKSNKSETLLNAKEFHASSYSVRNNVMLACRSY